MYVCSPLIIYLLESLYHIIICFPKEAIVIGQRDKTTAIPEEKYGFNDNRIHAKDEPMLNTITASLHKGKVELHSF